MAYGVKIMKFDSGQSTKIGDIVLESCKSTIIRHYREYTEAANEERASEARIKLISNRQYYVWLKVVLLNNS